MDNRKEASYSGIREEERKMRSKPFFIRVWIAKNYGRLGTYINFVVFNLGYVSESPTDFV